MKNDKLKQLRKDLSEARDIIAQQQRDIDRYQDQWADYERCKIENQSLTIALSLHQDYVFMLLDYLRDAKALSKGTNEIIARFNGKSWRAGSKQQ